MVGLTVDSVPLLDKVIERLSVVWSGDVDLAIGSLRGAVSWWRSGGVGEGVWADLICSNRLATSFTFTPPMFLKPVLEAVGSSNGFELLGRLGELGFELSSARSRICNKGSSVDFVFPGLPRSGVVRAVLVKD